MPSLPSMSIENGDTKAGFAASYKIIEGNISSGAQEHMCMETLGAICKPSGESQEMEITYTGQTPTELQVCRNILTLHHVISL